MRHLAIVLLTLAHAFLPPTITAADIPKCDYADPPADEPALNSNVKGGVVKNTTITLPQGWDVELEEPLLVLSDGPLTINGDIFASDTTDPISQSNGRR